MWRQMDYAAQKAQRKMEKRAAKHWCENEPAAFLTLFCDVPKIFVQKIFWNEKPS
jgi:hypothetical protein